MTLSKWPDRVTIWRWHFYAGLLCIPFVMWLAATGSIYLFKPQIDSLLDRPYAHLSISGPAAAPSAQVAAALAAVPGAALSQYVLPRSEHSAVQILVGHEQDLKRVYVHPATLQILHIANEDDRLPNLIFHLHGELLAGDRGSMVVETAASWAIVMLVTGLFLWWPQQSNGLAGVVFPRWSRTGRLFWRDLHAVTGFWVSFFALFLLISGLPWATSWGGLLKGVRQWSESTSIHQDWTTGRSSELQQRKLATTAPDEHADHHPGGAASVIDYKQIDGLVPLVAAAGLEPPVLITPPSAISPTWMSKSDTQNRPLRVELTLDGEDARVLSRQNFQQLPLLDRVIGIGIAAHEGQLFAPLNQLLGLFTAVSLWLVCISAIVMWWRRRPQGVLGAPPRPASAPWSIGVTGLTALLALLLPMLGVTLLLVLALEWAFLRRWPAARQFLGLSGPVLS